MDEIQSTDQRIRKAALHLFAAKGFAATGIREIAASAGVSSAALYHYMGTKDELLVRLMRGVLQYLADGARIIMQTVSLPEEQVAALVQFHVQVHARHSLETLVLDNELRVLSDSVRGDILGLSDAYEDMWRHAVESGLRQRVFHDVEPTHARLALITMSTGVNAWYAESGGLTPEDLGVSYAALALSLLNAARDGRRCRVDEMDNLPSPTWFAKMSQEIVVENQVPLP